MSLIHRRLRVIGARRLPAYAVQVLRPVSDAAAGGWTTQAGGTTNLYAVLDEDAPDDADYLRSSPSPASPDVAEVAFAASGDPGVGYGHVLTYRYGKDAAGDRIDLTVSLVEGTTVIASWTHTDVPAGWTDATQVLTTTQADAITNYGALALRLSAVAV